MDLSMEFLIVWEIAIHHVSLVMVQVLQTVLTAQWESFRMEVLVANVMFLAKIAMGHQPLSAQAVLLDLISTVMKIPAGVMTGLYLMEWVVFLALHLVPIVK
jgi:hypothetical protein